MTGLGNEKSPKVESVTLEANGIDNPLPLQVGVTYKVHLRRNEEAYFRTSTAVVETKAILDARLTGARDGHLSGLLAISRADGTVLNNRFMQFNEADVARREVGVFAENSAAVVGLKLSNSGTEQHTFWLTLVSDREFRWVPLFGEVTPQPIRLNETQAGVLDRYESAYYASSAPVGKYRVYLDFEGSTRRRSNLIGYVAVLDADGGRQRQILTLNEVDTSFRASSEFLVKTERGVIIRVHNRSDAVKYALRLEAS